MKKNKMMRAASGLLVATLLTTSIISGTFAKYTTEASGSDTARVAKFGVVLQADGSLYGDKYGTGTSVPSSTDTALTVKSEQEAKVVAPGTKNDSGFSFSINGTPEVSTKLTATIKSQNIYLKAGTYAVMVKAPTVTATSWKAGTYYTKDDAANTYSLQSDFAEGTTYYTMEDKVDLDQNYYPVIYKSTDKIDGTTETDSLGAIAADYAKKLNNNTEVTGTPDISNSDVTEYKVTKEYDPNTDFSTLQVAGESLTWAWTFDAQNDGADTILADLQAGTSSDAEVVVITTGEGAAIKAPVEHTDYNLNTSFSIDIKVEQVD